VSRLTPLAASLLHCRGTSGKGKGSSRLSELPDEETEQVTGHITAQVTEQVVQLLPAGEGEQSRAQVGQSSASWLREESFDVAGSVQDPHDLNAVGNREIENDVTAHWEAAQAFSQLLPPPTKPSLLRQQLELLIDQVDERIGLIVAVFGDELPDV